MSSEALKPTPKRGRPAFMCGPSKDYYYGDPPPPKESGYGVHGMAGRPTAKATASEGEDMTTPPPEALAREIDKRWIEEHIHEPGCYYEGEFDERMCRGVIAADIRRAIALALTQQAREIERLTLELDNVWWSTPHDLRALGWHVAVHNDYRQDGKPMTFWLFTHPNGRWIKGEGRTDVEALVSARDAAQGLT